MAECGVYDVYDDEAEAEGAASTALFRRIINWGFRKNYGSRFCDLLFRGLTPSHRLSTPKTNGHVQLSTFIAHLIYSESPL